MGYMLVRHLVHETVIRTKGLFFSSILTLKFMTSVKRNRSMLQSLNLLKPESHSLKMIRVGSTFDGGYVIPEESLKVDALFSPGVADNCDFEIQFAEIGVKCFMADFSVSNAPLEHDNFSFIKKFIEPVPSEIAITLDQWVASTKTTSRDLFLSMDVEGAEYRIIPTLDDDLLLRFKYVTLELHDLHKLHSKDFLKLFLSTMNRILQNHSIVQLHANNFSPRLRIWDKKFASVMEITLIRNSDNSVRKNYPISISSDLNSPNDSSRRDYKIYL